MSRAGTYVIIYLIQFAKYGKAKPIRNIYFSNGSTCFLIFLELRQQARSHDGTNTFYPWRCCIPVCVSRSMAQCPKCRAELTLGAQYCGQCGAATSAPQSTEVTARPRSASAIFTASAYIVQTKISESYKSLHGRLQLGTVSQLSVFEIREVSGALVAIARHMSEGKSPESVASLANLSSLVSSLRAYSLETPEGVRIGELQGSGALIPNRPYLEIKDANGENIAIIMMRVAKKPGAGFFSTGVTTWARGDS